ncbi:Ig-like domain-containing protein [Edwardsiella anguillarum]|uniref:Ig-like domain-containing protein n=2 Tax=Edwardsiella anguillarum TaxID=1821960 RepID=UPI0024B81BDE|nr:inverse autotransporter beta domain-containing protein [Edwardsiella anguillarum]WHQ14462.1 inverse autotransporter beta domain-containing protein [Edwardsiella anguillarum]
MSEYSFMSGGVLKSKIKNILFFIFILLSFVCVAYAGQTNYYTLYQDSKLIPNSNINSGNIIYYTLKKGENAAYIAKKNGISIDAIWSINKSYYSSRQSMLSAGSGDILRLPLKSLGALDGLPALGSIEMTDNFQTVRQGMPGERSVLWQPSEVGSTVSADRLYGGRAQPTSAQTLNGQQTGSMALAMASGQASGALQAWMSQFGTAEVNLQAGNGWDGSSLDWLLPFYDTPAMLAFSQVGARYINSRFTANVGGGQRFFFDHGMVGYNTFIDQDISGNNSRLGVGIEYWRDYLKTSLNTYFRLSGWHQSYDQSDYYERPANGFDLRVNAYLPSYPALGTKLIFEQYYGNNVALFDRDSKQSNPSAFTMGVNYTPIPLVTFGADYRLGAGGRNDTLYSLQFNYRFGDSWQQQISPQNVANLRSLQGSRYDLVQRNNNIVLDYKKQDVISLTIPDGMSGLEGTVRSITYSVKSKHAVSRIDWHDVELVRYGGKINKVGEGYQLEFPKYIKNGNNTYQVNARAIDSQGNISNVAVLLVTVLSDSGSGGTIVDTLTANKISAIADGTDEITYTALVQSGGKPQANVDVDFSIQRGVGTLSTVQAKSDAQGRAMVRLTATEVGEVVVAAKTADMSAPLAAAPVNFIAGGAIVVHEITADKSTALANGTDAISYTIRVSKNGVSQANTDVDVTTTAGSLSSPRVTTGADGVATVKLTSNAVANNVIVSAKTAEMATALDASPVNFVNVEPTVVSSITADKTQALADGVDAITYTVEVTQNHIAQPNVEVTFTTAAGTLSATKAVTDAAGRATVSLTSNAVANNVIVSAKTAEMTTALDASPVNFVNVEPTVVSSITADKTQALPDGVDAITYTVEVTQNHIAQPNVEVTFTTTAGTLSATKAVTDAAGRATVSLTSNAVANNVIVSAKTAEMATALDASPVNFVNVEPTVVSSISADKTQALADGVDAITYTVEVTQNHIAQPNVEVTFTTAAGTLSATKAVTDAAGRATVSLTSNAVANNVIVSAKTAEMATALDASPVNFVNVEPTVVSSITADKTQALADGVDAITYTVEVTQNHIAQPNVEVTFTTAAGTLSAAKAVTDAAGRATVSLTSNAVANNVIVSAKTAEMATALDASPVNFVNVEPTVVSSITADKTQALPDGVDAITYTVEVTQNHIAQPNVEVNFTTTAGTLSATKAVTDAAGRVTVSLTSNAVANNVIVSAKTAEMTTALDASPVNFSNNPSVATLTADNEFAVANGTSGVTFTATVMRDGAPAAGIPVTFATSGGTLSATDVTTEADGTARVILTSVTAGQATVSATTAGGTPATKTVTFNAVLEITGVLIPGSGGTSVPSVWLEGGQIQLVVRGGGAGLQYASSAASATVNDSGLITLDSAGDATIQVTSPEDGQTASYTLNTPAVFVRPEFATQRNYSAARTYCIAQGGALAADQSVLQNVRMLWGDANRYPAYAGLVARQAWVEQTPTDIAGGVGKTYDLIRGNPQSNVNVSTANVYAVCIH